MRGLPDDVDWGAVRGYVYATVVQFGLILCALKALDFVFPKLAWDYLAKISFLGDGTQLPGKAKSVAVFLFFLYMSFRCATPPSPLPPLASSTILFRHGRRARDACCC